MAKKEGLLKRLVRYGVIGLLIAILSFIIMLPITAGMVLLGVSMFTHPVVMLVIYAIYLPFTFVITGFAAVKVVEWLGWKKSGKARF